MEIHITNQPGGIIQQTDKPIINNFGHTTEEEIKITQAVINDPEALDHGRLPLFVTDKAQLITLVRDLSVCKDTADVCRAVAKLGGGKIRSEYMQKTFAAALLPMLRFESTESAIYQALKNFS